MVEKHGLFGNVKLNFNSNIKLSGGENNNGIIEYNSNLYLQSFNSTLSLINNSNAKFDLQRINLKAIKTSNAKISGKDGILTFEKEANIIFNGNQNTCHFQSNSNLKFDGNHCHTTFIGNSNVKVDGSHNRIMASDNSNLKISGDKNNISINGTSNHELKIVQENQEAMNVVQIIPNSSCPGRLGVSGGSSSFFKWSGSGSQCNVKYSIDYINKASINKRDYSIGIFKFDMQTDLAENRIKMCFNNAELDTGSFEMAPLVASNTVIMTAKKDGVKQSLKVVAPGITTESGGGTTTVLVDLIVSAGL